MDALRFNKIAAAVLCAGLLIMGFSKVGSFLVNPKDLKENAYPIEVANVDAKNTQVKEASVIEPIISLLASANIMEGEKVAKAIASHNPLGNAPKPGEGPSKEVRDAGYYEMLFLGLKDNEIKYKKTNYNTIKKYKIYLKFAMLIF